MILTLLLPWFPIVLAVGVGGRLLGRTRGGAFGALCALFWIALLQAGNGAAVWTQPWTVATILAGAVAITAMGRWSGDMPDAEALSTLRPAGAKGELPLGTACEIDPASPALFCEAFERFDEWLCDHRDDSDPWPNFDEFIRTTLHRTCRATHVRPYRVLAGGEELTPLREVEASTPSSRLSSRRGIVGHVVTTGEPYRAGDETRGELIETLASESSESPAWCFAVRQGARRLGVVVVGQMELAAGRYGSRLRAVERLLNQFWITLDEVVRSRSAEQIDPASGLPTRSAFFREAAESLEASYRQGEPVAVAVIAVQGLRELTDTGRWEAADEVLRACCEELRKKVRLDDSLGRFDGSRLVLLFRRVDSELAALIMRQTAARLSDICRDEQRWGTHVVVRCGLAGSGTEQPDLNQLLSRAIAQNRRARVENVTVASDMDLRPHAAVGASTPSRALPDATPPTRGDATGAPPTRGDATNERGRVASRTPEDVPAHSDLRAGPAPSTVCEVAATTVGACVPEAARAQAHGAPGGTA